MDVRGVNRSVWQRLFKATCQILPALMAWDRTCSHPHWQCQPMDGVSLPNRDSMEIPMDQSRQPPSKLKFSDMRPSDDPDTVNFLLSFAAPTSRLAVLSLSTNTLICTRANIS